MASGLTPRVFLPTQGPDLIKDRTMRSLPSITRPKGPGTLCSSGLSTTCSDTVRAAWRHFVTRAGDIANDSAELCPSRAAHATDATKMQAQIPGDLPGDGRLWEAVT